MSENDIIRAEVRLDPVLDADIIEEIEKSGMSRTIFFKLAAREMMKRREEEKVDERVKRLLSEVLAERGEVKPIEKVENKTRLGFGAKKI